MSLKPTLPLLLALLSGPLSAQRSAPEQPTPIPDEVVKLSPFTVDTSEDVGYQAGNTTSGSRLNTSLKDTAAPIQVFTPEFIDDLGQDNLQGILGYAANVQPDLSDGTQAFGGTPLGRPDSGYQDFVFTQRGLATTRSRNYFNTPLPTDEYNIDRLELLSGPNSILAGLGAAGGSVNSNTKHAEVNRSHELVKVQVGSYDFWRVQGDINAVIIPDVLAIRVMGVKQDTKGWRYWDYSDKEAGTLAVTYHPFKKTVITGSYEKGEDNRHLTLPWNAEDGLALWLANGRPTESGAFPTAGAAAQQAKGITTYGATNGNTFIDNNGTYINQKGQGISEFNNLSLPATSRPTDASLVPPSIMPYNYSWSGPSSLYQVKYDALNLSLEQEITPDLSFQATYDRQRAFNNTYFAFVDTLYGDPNQTVVNGSGQTVANPYAGRLYFEDNWANGTSLSDNQSYRGNLAYNLKLGRWFGHHRIDLMGQRTVVETTTNLKNQVLVDDNNHPYGTTLDGADNKLIRRQYVTEGDYSTYYNGDYRVPFSANINGVQYHSRWVNTNPNQMTLAKNTTNSGLATLQDYFLDDKLVTTFGIRRDFITYDRNEVGRTAAGDGRIADGQLLLNEIAFLPIIDESYYTSTTETMGGVYHALPWFSVFFDYSKNVGVPDFRTTVLPDGRVGPPSDANSKDMGFMLNLLDGKAFLRVTYFQTSANNLIGMNIQTLVTAPRNRINTALLTAKVITQADYDQMNVTARTALIDQQAKGGEATLTTNLTSNWALIGNASYTDLKDSNFFSEFDPYIASAQTYWKAKLAAAGLTTTSLKTAGAASLGTIQDEINGMISAVALQREAYNFNYGVRPWKASVFTHYRFTRGWSKGIMIGGGVRYQGENVLQKDFTTNTVYHGSPLINVDALAGYQFARPLFGRTGRFRIQANVTNVLNDTDPIVGRYNSNFTDVKRVILRDPAMFRLSVSEDF